jgi:hypothetical protein
MAKSSYGWSTLQLHHKIEKKKKKKTLEQGIKTFKDDDHYS